MTAVDTTGPWCEGFDADVLSGLADAAVQLRHAIGATS